MKIDVDDLMRPEVRKLLTEHLQGMAEHSPPDCIHALDVEQLRSRDVTFWSVWDDQELLGCGALKELDSTHGEIKSMRTAGKHLGKGVGSALVRHIIATAEERGYERLSLETGSGDAFEPAHSLYRNFGFEFCGAFADYRENPFSRFMTISLK